MKHYKVKPKNGQKSIAGTGFFLTFKKGSAVVSEEDLKNKHLQNAVQVVEEIKETPAAPAPEIEKKELEVKAEKGGK